MKQLTRSELRKNIMTILYQINVYSINKIEYNVDDIIKEVNPIDNEFVKDMVYGVVTKKEEIDEKKELLLHYFALLVILLLLILRFITIVLILSALLK